MKQRIEVSISKDDEFEIKVSSIGSVRFLSEEEGKSSLGPNPLELFLSSLGTCICLYSKKYLIRHDIKFEFLKVNVEANFTTEAPARLSNIEARVQTDAVLGEKMDVFLRFIKNCPIHNTIVNTQELSIVVG